MSFRAPLSVEEDAAEIMKRNGDSPRARLQRKERFVREDARDDFWSISKIQNFFPKNCSFVLSPNVLARWVTRWYFLSSLNSPDCVYWEETRGAQRLCLTSLDPTSNATHYYPLGPPLTPASLTLQPGRPPSNHPPSYLEEKPHRTSAHGRYISLLSPTNPRPNHLVPTKPMILQPTHPLVEDGVLDPMLYLVWEGHPIGVPLVVTVEEGGTYETCQWSRSLNRGRVEIWLWSRPALYTGCYIGGAFPKRLFITCPPTFIDPSVEIHIGLHAN